MANLTSLSKIVHTRFVISFSKWFFQNHNSTHISTSKIYQRDTFESKMGGPIKLAAIKFIEESRSQLIPDESVIILEKTASDYVDDFFSNVSSKVSEKREDSFPHVDRRGQCISHKTILY